MDHRVRNYLIRAHDKVITHYRQVLQANSLTQPERERIRRRLADVEAELQTISGNVSSDPMPLAQRERRHHNVPLSASEEVDL